MLVSGHTTIATDIGALLAAHAGEALRLRFAETDNLAQFQVGLDNVRIDVVPEPSTLLPFGVATFAIVSTTRPPRRAAALRSMKVEEAFAGDPDPRQRAQSADRHRVPRVGQRLPRAREGVGRSSR